MARSGWKALIGMVGILLVCCGLRPAYADDQAGHPPRVQKVRVLLITGGHDYAEAPFMGMFRGHPDIVVRHVEQPAAQGWFAPDKADRYDVMVWYDMYPQISEKGRDALLKLLEQGKPLVALHHALGDYRQWPPILDILGGHVFLTRQGEATDFSYQHGADLRVTFADPEHPIVRGMSPFTLHDEAYKGFTVLPTVKPLLKTDHPASDAVIGWTHRFGQSPVVYLAPGHGPQAFQDGNYRRLVAQSIRWAAGLLPGRSEEGFVSLFDGKTLDGWRIMGEPEGFQVVDGVIRSESGRRGLWLCSERRYADFILRLEWRVAREGNSGVFIRCGREGYPWVTGSEVQITHEKRDDLHCTGALYGRVAVDPRPVTRPGVWHTFEIQCRGPRIRVFTDGLPVVDVDQRQVERLRNRARKGYIGLQDSHNPQGWIEYRRIRIKTLDGSDTRPEQAQQP